MKVDVLYPIPEITLNHGMISSRSQLLLVLDFHPMREFLHGL